MRDAYLYEDCDMQILLGYGRTENCLRIMPSMSVLRWWHITPYLMIWVINQNRNI